MGYELLQTDDVPVTDLSQIDELPPDQNIRPIGDALGLQNMRASLWYIEPGEEIQYHAHAEQEELYYILEGRFSLKLGPSGKTEIMEVGPGTFWAADPKTGHGHRNIGEETGVVLAIGAPAVDDPGLDPHTLDSKTE